MNALTPSSSYLSDNAAIASSAVSYSPRSTASLTACVNTANLPKAFSITSLSAHLVAKVVMKLSTVTSSPIFPNSRPTSISVCLSCFEAAPANSKLFQSNDCK